MKTEIDVQIRWLIRRDLPDVLRIEDESYSDPWGEQEFLFNLRQRNCIGMVAEYEHNVVGFMIYELHKEKIRILKMAVGENCRRCEIGSQMVIRLKDKLSQQRRDELIADVDEFNLPAQLFLKSHGFNAVLVIRGHYDNPVRDAYQMQFKVEENCFANRVENM